MPQSCGQSPVAFHRAGGGRFLVAHEQQNVSENAMNEKKKIHAGWCFCHKGSLNYAFCGDQTIQMYGEFEGFPLIVHCLGS